MIDFNEYEYISRIKRKEFLDFLEDLYNGTSLYIPIDIIYTKNPNSIFYIDEYRKIENVKDKKKLFNITYDKIFKHYNLDYLLLAFNNYGKMTFINYNVNKIQKIENGVETYYVLDEDGNETSCKLIDLLELLNIIIEKYPKTFEKYSEENINEIFTIVNKELYERLMENLYEKTGVKWSMSNDLINTPFITSSGKKRELIFLYPNDGTLSYGTLEDFEFYFKSNNPKYSLVTNDDFVSECEKVFPKLKNKEKYNQYNNNNLNLFLKFLSILDKDITVRQALEILSSEVEKRLSLEKGDLE